MTIEQIVLFRLYQALLMWIALILTGRLYTLVSRTRQASLRDDANASLVVVAATGVAQIVVSFVPALWPLVGVVYAITIYFAYRMEGYADLVFFCLSLGLILNALSLTGLFPRMTKYFTAF